MVDIILHHYDTSPFARKIRTILGVKQASWRSVTIPRIMPKPDLVALTGGYRRTPILQIGADIYCDTSLIAHKLDELFPEPPLYPDEQRATAGALSQWADTTLFQHAVPLAFQKDVLLKYFGSEEKMNAFLGDRVAMGKGSARRRILPDEATLFVNGFLDNLEQQLLDERKFLLGDTPTIADFSVYHALWFLYTKPIVCELFESLPHIRNWMQTIDDLGEGKATSLTSTEAIDIARESTPAPLEGTSCLPELSVGSEVVVAADDYGFDPVQGKLLHCDQQQMSVARTDERAGDVVVHFPRLVYTIKPAD